MLYPMDWHSADVVTVKGGNNFTNITEDVSEDGGSANFNCMNKTVATGCTVEEGGSLNIKGNNVILSEDFFIEKGGILTVN